MSKQVLSVPEVHCDHCVSSIEGAVGTLSGVSKVQVDLDRKDVTVDFDDSAVTLESIVAAIEGQGYDVGEEGSAKPNVIELGKRL